MDTAQPLAGETAAADFDTPEHQANRDFDAAGMTPLWRARQGLMPFHLRAGAATPATRTTASSVWQVFDGCGTDLDLFTFSDAPVIEQLALLRTQVCPA